jgi:hypothetical protein
MTSTFTEDELALLARVPHLVGTAMAVAGRSGLFGTGKELFAKGMAVFEGVKQFPNNSLIAAIVPRTDADRTDVMDKLRKGRDATMTRVKSQGVDSSEKLCTLALDDCRAVAQLLASKAPLPEATEYKAWALSVAEKVAMAASEGGFLGFGGERLSASEKELLDKLKAALG